jgi:hypothetical protein
MTDDHVASIEAWTRKKPKRIIQNQILIELILAYALPSVFLGVFAIMWTISIYPPTMSILLAIWTIALVSYLALGILRKKMK